MKKVGVIYNPMAEHRGGTQLAQTIQKALKKEGFTYDWIETQPHQTLSERLSKSDLSKSWKRLFAVGGDGTIAETAALLAQHKSTLPLAAIPCGTANLLAHTLKIPRNTPLKALEFGLKNEAQSIDMMRVTSGDRTRYGLIATGCGYDTHVMKGAPRGLKRKLGFGAYAWSIARSALTYRSQRYHLTIDGTQQTVDAKAIMAFNILPLVGQGNWVRQRIPEPVSIRDGQLNVAVFNPKTAVHLVSKNHGITPFTAKKIQITIPSSDPDPLEFQIDGDVFTGHELTIEVLPKALQLVYASEKDPSGFNKY